ncbi:hypothetical protein [Streptomyces radicis]|uniref:WXG100 family type VII secretion target n=1 Tax=Streptomyces radicis TaxID=1750517 RepID=A0A3A9W9N7_9ACTN|nr:hypothetical protein [Streptomyces radicis]RKN09419.1 hypothetical protein D7319_13275 [Streptomyces radicis]RKN22984.1 hypothetical protein D7318_13250 [Streptomyces radicis]
MPNISITFDDVDAAAAAMDNSRTEVIEPAVDAAKLAIDETLGRDLVLQDTEAAITDQYNILHGQLVDLALAIKSFADQFLNIKDGMIKFDQQYAELIRNPK